MKTKNTDGNEIGRVDAVHDYGAGPILEIFIQRLNSTFLIPFSEKSVPMVDLKERFLIIDPPEGIIPWKIYDRFSKIPWSTFNKGYDKTTRISTKSSRPEGNLES
tara:strand:- start:546 stop:860 length:315 start_codon:yes stop_codon:yes gene_type:complete